MYVHKLQKKNYLKVTDHCSKYAFEISDREKTVHQILLKQKLINR